MIDLRLPEINTSGNPAQQIASLQSYLYQMQQQLQYALETVEKESSETAKAIAANAVSASEKSLNKSPQNTFNQIKSLIINSADIVSKYEEVIRRSLQSEFAAKSDFGDFRQWAENRIEANSTGISQNFSNVQQLSADLNGGISRIEDALNAIDGELTELYETTACISSGVLYYDDEGFPVYGIYIGQKNIRNGEQVFDKFAMFSADRLSFFDSSGVEVAYISDEKLHITNAEISGNLKLGKYNISTANGIAFKWVGE